MARPTPARLAPAAVAVVLLVLAAGCTGTVPFGGPTTTRTSYAYPDPPRSLDVGTARRVALQAERSTLADRLAARGDGSRVGSATVAEATRAADLGDWVYVSVALPYTLVRNGNRAEAVATASYLVSAGAIRRIDTTARSVDADTFAGGRTVDEPVDVRVVDAANASRPVALSVTYRDAAETAYAGTFALADGDGLTVRSVASRIGTYRVTASSRGSIVSARVRVGPGATGPVVVVVEPDGALAVARVGRLEA